MGSNIEKVSDMDVPSGDNGDSDENATLPAQSNQDVAERLEQMMTQLSEDELMSALFGGC